jgi:hypothetical protein
MIRLGRPLSIVLRTFWTRFERIIAEVEVAVGAPDRPGPPFLLVVAQAGKLPGQPP